MQLTKIKHSKKYLWIIAATVILLVAGFMAWRAFYASPQPKVKPAQAEPNTVNYGPPSEQEKQEQAQTKDEIIKQQEQAANPPAQQTISLSISRASQAGDGQPLNIRTIISGASSGQCLVTLSQNGQLTINKVFAITSEATYSSCQSANIAASDFPAGGQWQLKVVAKNDSAESPAVSQSVTIVK